jgi:hypothetical protein
MSIDKYRGLEKIGTEANRRGFKDTAKYVASRYVRVIRQQFSDIGRIT